MYDVKHARGKFVTTSQKNPLFLSPHQPFHMKKTQRHQGIVRNPYIKYDFKSPRAKKTASRTVLLIFYLFYRSLSVSL